MAQLQKLQTNLSFVELPGAKSEGTLDINEMKLLKEEGNLTSRFKNIRLNCKTRR